MDRTEGATRITEEEVVITITTTKTIEVEAKIEVDIRSMTTTGEDRVTRNHLIRVVSRDREATTIRDRTNRCLSKIRCKRGSSLMCRSQNLSSPHLPKLKVPKSLTSTCLKSTWMR